LRAQQQLIDDRRLRVRVGAAAEEREVIDGGLVARRGGAEPTPRLDLRPRAGEVEQFLELHILGDAVEQTVDRIDADRGQHLGDVVRAVGDVAVNVTEMLADRKSTRLNSSHVKISYAVFCVRK